MNGIIIAAIIEGVSTRADGTVKVVIGCQELNPVNMAQVMALNRKLSAIYISPKETVSQKEIDQVDQVDPVMPAKSPSQRMRNVLYRLWEQDPEGFKSFEQYYPWKMDIYINQIKSNLNP